MTLTISREVSRNGGAKQYRAAQSDEAAWIRAHRPKPCKLKGNAYLCRTISAKLARKWSPQQIAGWLMHEHPDEEDKRISHETIYRSLFIQARGVLKKELLSHLRATRSIRRSRHKTRKQPFALLLNLIVLIQIVLVLVLTIPPLRFYIFNWML